MNFQRPGSRACGFLPGFHREDPLPEGNFVPRLRPGRILLQPEGNRHGVFSGNRLFAEGQRIGLFGKRRHVRLHGLPGHALPVPLQRHNAAERRGGSEHVPVDHRHPFRVRLDHDVLIAVFHFLQFRGFLSVRKHNSVAAEDAVVRPVVPVPAVQQRFLSAPVPGGQRLIDKVPDKPALVKLLFIRQLCVLVHGAVGVAHGVGVFAQDERLLPVLLQIGPHPVRRGIHFRFNVRDLPDAQVSPAHVFNLMIAFVMHGS